MTFPSIQLVIVIATILGVVFYSRWRFGLFKKAEEEMSSGYTGLNGAARLYLKYKNEDQNKGKNLSALMEIPILIYREWLIKTGHWVNPDNQAEWEIQAQLNILMECQIITLSERFIEDLLPAHKETLQRKRKQLILTDDYGVVDNSRWIAELRYFIENVVVPRGEPTKEDYFSALIPIIDDAVLTCEPRDDGCDFLGNDPRDYESWCADQLSNHGWVARLTSYTGDQGVDIIAEKNGVKLALQCKFYSGPVGNKAVQEVVSGAAFVGANMSAVVTNTNYTQAAKELAQSNNVILLHHSELKHLGSTIFSTPSGMDKLIATDDDNEITVKRVLGPKELIQEAGGRSRLVTRCTACGYEKTSSDITLGAAECPVCGSVY